MWIESHNKFWVNVNVISVSPLLSEKWLFRWLSENWPFKSFRGYLSPYRLLSNRECEFKQSWAALKPILWALKIAPVKAILKSFVYRDFSYSLHLLRSLTEKFDKNIRCLESEQTWSNFYFIHCCVQPNYLAYWILVLIHRLSLPEQFPAQCQTCWISLSQ